jgi:hypothetical protein
MLHLLTYSSTPPGERISRREWLRLGVSQQTVGGPG